MKIVAWVLAVVLALLGLVFVAGSQGMLSRIVIGAVLFAAAIALVAVAQLRPKSSVTVVQKIDLPGESRARELKCNKCGASLPANAVKVNDAGAAIVACPYCNTSYQIEEAPKW